MERKLERVGPIPHPSIGTQVASGSWLGRATPIQRNSVVSRASAGTVSRHAPSIALFLAARAEYRILSSS